MPGATKKRKRKQRGTQGGRVGGRRSRPRSRAEAKAQARSGRSSKKGASRTQRMSERVGAPPTWRGAVNRALIASGIFLLLLVLLFGQPFLQAFGLAAFMLLVYIPMGYYMDRFFYRMKLRREQKKQLEAKAEKDTPKDKA
jgi:hypothetical protein